MSDDTREYALGTSLTSRYPWGLFVRARVLCADGKVRATSRVAATADTFFSVPCAVKAAGRTVSGYLTVTTMSDSSIETDDDPAVVTFRPYRYGRNYDALPEWDGRSPREVTQ